MSAWRKKAIECLPGHRLEFEQPETSIYGVFFEMLPALRTAHADRDHETLRKIYRFAEWCFRQKDKTIWNAAAVAFYEHLGDDELTFSAIPTYVKADIYKEIRPLLDARLDDEKISWLDASYGLPKLTRRK